MSTCMTKFTQSQALSGSIKIEEETMVMQKQGIVTILDSDCDTNMSSLQRTLSADMSSKKWLSQKESFPMKKIASFEELFHPKTNIADSLSSSSEEGEEGKEIIEADDADADDEDEAERERLEIWSSIQRNKKEEQEKEGGAFDMWNSLISLKKNKDELSKSLPVTPYVHPLVQRSKSSLSEKSLEICTESLGSETGSDGLFPSYPPETGETEQNKENEQHQQNQQEKMLDAPYEPQEELQVSRYKSPPRSFPPPLPSLSSRQPACTSLTMRSHRDNGRLVLEAVSVPSQNKLSVQRQDGRLVLTFSNHYDHEERVEDADEVSQKEDNDGVDELEEEFEEEVEDSDETEEAEETEEEEEIWETDSDVMDEENTIIEKAPILSSGVTGSIQRLSFVMNKPIGVVNRNPNWSEKFNEVVNFDDVKVVEQSSIAKSLPPRPRVPRLIPSSQTVASAAAAASFNSNAYEYYWKTNSTTKSASPHNTHNNDSPMKESNNNNKLISNEKQHLLVLRGKNGDYLVHNVKSCKDSRRSFLFWEPYCIATS